MADPVLVPAAPVIAQPSRPGETDTSPGLEALQKAFDQVIPEIKTRPSEVRPEEPRKETPQPEKVPQQAPIPPEEPIKDPMEPEKEPAHEVPPSILEQALKTSSSQAPPETAPEDEWPEELPSFKTPEESKERYRKWRRSYNEQKKELEGLRNKPSLSGEQLARLEMLEGQNRQMSEILSRVGVEHSREFQQNIMRPLQQCWGEAVRIVKQAGGDPQALAKAMSLNGKGQFEALDELFSEMPESAKMEAHDALRNYRRYEEMRRAAVQNAPAAMEGIRKREMERQYAEVNKQREEMKGIFERAYSRLKDEAKLEIFQRTDLPEGKWWNEQGERMKEQGRSLYLENTDMDRVALACLLAPAADTYRSLWLKSQHRINELNKIIKDRLGGEPNLNESSGNAATPSGTLAEDLKKPFSEVFLREFHKAQSRNR